MGPIDAWALKTRVVVSNRYVGLKDVAALAGVSFQTVSKVLNGGPVRVSPETASRVRAAAEELGYLPNGVARSLVGRTTRTVGLIAGNLGDPALAEFAIGADLAAREHGLAVLIGNLTDAGGGGVEIARLLVERRVDGIIAAAPQLEEDLAVAEVLRSTVPSVSLHHVPGGGVPMVGSNHKYVGWLAADHLVSGGRRVIGTVAGPFRRRVVRSRLNGLEQRLSEEGTDQSEDLVVEADWSPRGASAATRLLLQRVPSLDAVFVHSDLMAVGVLDAIEASGRRVPDDVAVVSCDDLSFAAHLRPPLTTVRVPLREAGAQAVELLLSRLSGEEREVQTVLLPVELIVRQSSGAACQSRGVRVRSGRRGKR